MTTITERAMNEATSKPTNRYDELNPAAKNMIDRLIDTIASSGEECEFPLASNKPKGNGQRIYTILDVATVAIAHNWMIEAVAA